MRHPYLNTVFFALTATAVFVHGCGIFETREPENPGGSANVWIPPVTPKDVLDNISRAFALHDGILYMKSYAGGGDSDSGFTFLPDISSANLDTSVFTEWDFSREQSFILSLFSHDFIPQDSTAFFQFIYESGTPGENKPVYRESYTIRLGHSREGIPKEYSGNARIQFERNYNGDWVIIRWEDEPSGDAPTFSHLKSVISN